MQEEQKQACLRTERGYPALFPFKTFNGRAWPSRLLNAVVVVVPRRQDLRDVHTHRCTRKCADRNALAHRCSRDRKHFRLEASSSSMVCGRKRPHVSMASTSALPKSHQVDLGLNGPAEVQQHIYQHVNPLGHNLKSIIFKQRGKTPSLFGPSLRCFEEKAR